MCGTSRRLSFRPAFIYPGSRRLLWMSSPVRGRGQPGIFSQKNASAVTSRGARFLLGEDAKSRVAVPRGRRRAAEGGERKRDLGRPRRRLWRGHVLLLPTGVRARWNPARGRRRGPTRPRPAALSPPLSVRETSGPGTPPARRPSASARLPLPPHPKLFSAFSGITRVLFARTRSRASSIGRSGNSVGLLSTTPRDGAGNKLSLIARLSPDVVMVVCFDVGGGRPVVGID